MVYYYDPTVQRYGTVDKPDAGDTVQIVYAGDKVATSVSKAQLMPAGSIANFMQGENNAIQEVIFNTVARAVIAVGYDKKSATSQEVKQFAMVEAAYQLFARDYLRWIQLTANSPSEIQDPRQWFTSSDWEGAVNAELQQEIVNQAYNVIFKKGFKLNIAEFMRGFVARILSNIVQRRQQSTGTSFRAQ